MSYFIGWQLNPSTGWGRYGMELARELGRRREQVVALNIAGAQQEPPLHQLALRAVGDWTALSQTIKHLQVDTAFVALGNHGQGSELPEGLTARRTIACIFSEDTAWAPDEIERLNGYDLVVAGSTWNAEVLRAAGVARVEVVIQGVNPAIWHPAPRNPTFSGRFAVFSGGKLEFRKGQDIVVAAFRQFRAKHPEALLVTAWQNVWPATMQGIDAAGHVHGVPGTKGSAVDITSWLERNGVPRTSSIDVGLVPNHLMADIVRACDVAVFPNRAEGGTNLVAMECIAAAVPTILSCNTGHHDIKAAAISITSQGTVPAGCSLYQGTDGWGETAVDDLVAELDQVHARQPRLLRLFGEGYSWSVTVDRLLEVIA